MRRFCLPFLLISFLSACGASDTNPDLDGDGVVNELDAFPRDALESVDSDGDGVGNNADAFPDDATETVDSDSDGVGDNSDAFPQDASESVDSDGDLVGDIADAFPQDATESVDSDLDGVGDNSDAFPQDINESTDSDGDGTGDNADPFPNDVDNDGIADVYDERTVSDTSLVGTWVSFGEHYLMLAPSLTNGVLLVVEDTSKDYFVIRNSINGLEIVSCTADGFNSPVGANDISVGDDQVNLGDSFGIIDHSNLSGTVDNNRKINASFSLQHAPSLVQTLSYQMIKISDSTAPIGNASITVAGEETESLQVFCLSQLDRTITENGESKEIKSYRLSMGDSLELQLEQRLMPERTTLRLMGDFYDEGQDAINSSIDNQDDLNFSMTFNASGQFSDVSGTVQIQLPMQ